VKNSGVAIGPRRDAGKEGEEMSMLMNRLRMLLLALAMPSILA
jgi:hypothetical protein